MFTNKVSSFLNELILNGYNINVKNEEISREERLVGDLIITVEDNLLKKVYVIKICMFNRKECIHKLIPVTDLNKIKENYWITHCASLKRDKESYNFEYEYKFNDNELNIGYKIYEWRDMEDENFFEDDDIMDEGVEVVNIKHILSILKKHFEEDQLKFMK